MPSQIQNVSGLGVIPPYVRNGHRLTGSPIGPLTVSPEGFYPQVFPVAASGVQPVQNNPQGEQEDPLRQMPIRLAAYANEVGAAFKSIIGMTAVRSLNIFSALYSLADVAQQTHSEYQDPPASKKDDRKTWAAKHAVDATIFQGLASIWLPYFTVDKFRGFLEGQAKERFSHLSSNAKKWGPAAISLGLIPLLAKPIDILVNFTMNYTTRLAMHLPKTPLFETEPNQPVRPKPAGLFQLPRL